MSSKKKLIISLSVAAAVLVAAIIAIVAVFAAGQQAVKTGIRVRFNAGDDVACEIVGTWAMEDAEEDADPAQKGDIGSVIITADLEKDTFELSEGEIDVELNKTQNYVDFTYEFTNIGSDAFIIKLSQEVKGNGVEVKYIVDETEKSVTEMVNTGVTVPAVTAEDHTVVVTVRVTIPVENMGNSVSFTADIIWDLAVPGV